ncbi:hypothetical protein [Cupriavidus sp. TMH.W2]|uniref:hypothetical protein n=1 Tax=Cupriavidus sp. TMH.W2 TaxID=3434465 RepID=UPI003D77FBC9
MDDRFRILLAAGSTGWHGKAGDGCVSCRSDRFLDIYADADLHHQCAAAMPRPGNSSSLAAWMTGLDRRVSRSTDSIPPSRYVVFIAVLE